MIKYILILLFPLLTFSQSVSIGFDYQNALYGSGVNKPSLDIQLRFISTEKWGEIGIEFEKFNEIDYFSWGLFTNKSFKINKVELLCGVEVIQIVRNEVAWFSYGFNAETRYFFTDKIGIGLQYNYRWRRDLEILYNDGRFIGSGFINLIYKWK